MDKTSTFLVTKALKEDGNAIDVVPEEWQRSGSSLWFHLDLGIEGAEGWIQSESGLSEIAASALIMDDTRPRIAAFEDGVVICLRGVNCNAGADPEDMVALRMWIGEKRLLTLRHRQVMAVNDLLNALSEGTGPCNRGEFLAMISNLLTERIAEVVGEISEEFDKIEDSVITGGDYRIRARLLDLRRVMIRLRRYLAPQREVFSRLSYEAFPWLEDSDKFLLRECADHTVRFLEDLDALRDRAAVMQEELNGQLSEQMNRNFYMMSIVATIFLPLGLITGLLGINVGGIPGSSTPLAFYVVCGVLLCIAAVEYIYFKKRQLVHYRNGG